MNLDNVELNKKYRWKELCHNLEIPDNLQGNSKIAQRKELKRYLKIKKEKNSYIIIEKYNTPKDRFDKRLKQYDNFNISYEQWNNIGVYSIIQNNNIYIGSTIDGFRRRFLRHLEKDNPLPTKQMLETGAIFSIIEDLTGYSEEYIRAKENEYIQQYLEDDNFNLINVRDAHCHCEKKDKIKNIKYKIKESDIPLANKIIKKALAEAGIDIY